MRSALCAACFACSTSTALSQISFSTELIHFGDDLWGVDVLIDVDHPHPWVAGGITSNGFPLADGIAFVYQPGAEPLIAPGGAGNPGNPVTFVSKPREQFSAQRFGQNGAPLLAGGYDPPVPDPAATARELNVAWVQLTPEPDAVLDQGAIARVVIDISASAYAGQAVTLSPGGEILSELLVISDVGLGASPNPHTGFAFHAVPEPAPWAMLALLLTGATRRY